EVPTIDDNSAAGGAFHLKKHISGSKKPCGGDQNVGGFDKAQRGFGLFVPLDAEGIHRHIGDMVEHNGRSEIGLFDAKAYIAQGEAADFARIQTESRGRGDLEMLSRDLRDFALSFFGSAASAEGDVHVAQNDILEEPIADAIEDDALAGFAGAIAGLESHVRKLPAFGHNMSANPFEHDVAD